MDSQHSLPENVTNTVRYELYLSKTPDESIVDRYKERIKPIWKDIAGDFSLAIDDDLKICYGTYDVNQNIEREWLIIYALYDLSRFDRDLVITVQDSDGQILLITAAEALPKWLESSRSKNRVFIHQGKLHIIPEEVNLKDLQKNYSKSCTTVTQAAAGFVRDVNNKSPSSSLQQTSCSRVFETLADKPIQAAIEEQLSGMPDQRAWLMRKFKQLDDILSGDEGMDDKEELQKRFGEGDISLASVMAMDEEDLMVSPLSSRPSSIASCSSSSSSAWLTEHEDD